MNNCSCIKGNYNFKLEHLGCNLMLYRDLSVWMTGSGYVIPDTYTLKITLPGRTVPISIQVKTNDINKITPEDLNLRGSSFPDGIYCFEVVSCDNVYQKYRANTCELECCLDNFVTQIPSEKDYKIAYDLDMHIHTIKTLAERGASEKAKSQYSVAQKIIQNFNCNCK